MAYWRLSMRKIMEVLRLRHANGLSVSPIAESCQVSRSTVSEYLNRAEAAGISWPLPEGMGEDDLERILFKREDVWGDRSGHLPDMEHINLEIKRKGMTLQLLWEEYKAKIPDGYQYTQFCELYHRWRGKLDVTLRQEHRAGEKVFVDYAGQRIGVTDAATGEVKEVNLFVSALGASSYTYAEATWTQGSKDWIGSHVRMFEFYGGVTEILVPDNLKSGVKHASYYEPDINPTYLELGRHYGVAIIPARARKPRDKAKVEAAVLLVERWILAVLRNRTFFSLGELNEAIREKLDILNGRKFKKLPTTRRELYEQIDRPALKPLPQRPYEYSEWRSARVHIDYHIEVEKHYYSVPYQLVGEKVEVRLTGAMVEVLHKGNRVASHARSHKAGGFTTDKVHMPKAHLEHTEWTPERVAQWAAKYGPSTELLVRRIMERTVHPEQSFRACLGIIRLGNKYSPERVEAACAKALIIKAHSYKSVKSILENGLDRQPDLFGHASGGSTPVNHSNIRGKEYYN